MSFELRDLLSYAILPAALAGIIRWRALHQAWAPFILLLVLGVVNEIAGSILIRSGYHNVIPNNIYVLCESLLLVWFFKRMQTFKTGSRTPWFMGSILIVIWIADSLILHPHRFNSYFVLAYSSIFAIISIGRINRLMVEYHGRLATNGLFLVLIGFITYYSYTLLVEIFWLYGLGVSESFRSNIYLIHVCINVLVNFTYLIAILCLPKKHVY